MLLCENKEPNQLLTIFNTRYHGTTREREEGREGERGRERKGERGRETDGIF